MNEQAIEKDVEVSEAEAAELEVAEPTKFVTKALIFESSALVQSVMTLPADFEMPGFLLVPLADGTACEAGMRYDSETGQFSPIPEREESEELLAELTLSSEQPPTKQ